MNLSGNTILITGGGSGIGAALAHRLHDRGNKVIITGRRIAALKKTAAGREGMFTYQLDVADADAVADVCNRMVADHPDINVLINNAGIMRFEQIDTRRDLSDVEQTFNTNVIGLIRMVDAFVDHLKDQEDSAIINVTSGLAFVPMVTSASYCASKAAVHSYTMALRHALESQVEVIELPPPAVRTDLTPGHRDVEAFQPLDDFADEVLALLEQQPTPAELIPERTKFNRTAESEGRFEEAFNRINSHR